MSAKREIYNLLVANAQLDSLLARSNIQGAETLPAIYDQWPGDSAPMPYIITTWSFPEGNHWAQVAANLEIDIYTPGDNVQAEEIKDLCLTALAWQRIQTEAEGQINIYFGGNDGEILEPEPEVTHWNINFLVKYWRQNLIAAITQP